MSTPILRFVMIYASMYEFVCTFHVSTAHTALTSLELMLNMQYRKRRQEAHDLKSVCAVTVGDTNNLGENRDEYILRTSRQQAAGNRATGQQHRMNRA